MRGIIANEARCRELAERSLGLVTALTPKIGYHAAAEIAREAEKTGKSVKEIILSKGILIPQEIEEVLDSLALTEPGAIPKA